MALLRGAVDGGGGVGELGSLVKEEEEMYRQEDVMEVGLSGREREWVDDKGVQSPRVGRGWGSGGVCDLVWARRRR